MQKIEYHLKGDVFGCHDAAYVRELEDPTEMLVESVIQSVSTEIMVTIGVDEMHLAAWQDPEHWAQDWEEKGIDPDDVPGLVAAAQVTV